jgi:hypothetical protein
MLGGVERWPRVRGVNVVVVVVAVAEVGCVVVSGEFGVDGGWNEKDDGDG